LKWHFAEPHELLGALNRTLLGEFPDGDFHFTASVVDLRVGEHGVLALHSNAANPPLLLVSPSGLQEVYSDGPLLGVEQQTFPAPKRFEVARDQLLVLFSDGLSEQWNLRRERFDTQFATLRLAPAESAQAFSERLRQAFHSFRGAAELSDDVTFLALRLKPEPASARF
jgi:serine phosphatase RsbU (regulator of sigma subunit)